MPPSSQQGPHATPPSPIVEAPAAEDVLLLKAKHGDEAAFATLLEQLKPRLRRLFFGARGAEVDELLQEASLQLYRALGRYHDQGRGPSVARAWCYRVAMNVALMHHRKNRRRPPLALDDGFHLAIDEMSAESPAPPWAPPPDVGASLREQGRDVDQALERLPDKYRMVLWLADVEGHKVEDVAEILGITTPTVKARLLRARAVVRQKVGNKRPTVGDPRRPSP